MENNPKLIFWNAKLTVLAARRPLDTPKPNMAPNAILASKIDGSGAQAAP